MDRQDGSIGEELLKVHISYGPLVQEAAGQIQRRRPTGAKPRKSQVIKGFAHITGGGFVDNLPRVLPGDCDAVIAARSGRSRLFSDFFRTEGRSIEKEMYQVFNMDRDGGDCRAERRQDPGPGSCARRSAGSSAAGAPPWIT